MYPLFESLCVQDGQLLNVPWHQDRFQKAYLHRYGQAPSFDLLDGLHIPPDFAQGKVKLRIRYNELENNFHFEHYRMQKIQRLRLVHTEALDYSYKYSEREPLEALFAQKGDCDDVLIVRKGMITDSSYANVVFLMEKTGGRPKNLCFGAPAAPDCWPLGRYKKPRYNQVTLKTSKGLN